MFDVRSYQRHRRLCKEVSYNVPLLEIEDSTCNLDT